MNLSELRSDCWIIDNFLTESEIEELTNHIQKIEWVMFDDVQASNFKQPSSKGFHVLEENFETTEKSILRKILDLNFSGMPKIKKNLIECYIIVLKNMTLYITTHRFFFNRRLLDFYHIPKHKMGT